MILKGKTILFLPLLILILSINLDTYFFDDNFKKGIREKDILFKAIGSFRESIGAMVWLKTDEYFHGGIPRPKEEKCLEQGMDAEHEHEHKERHSTDVVRLAGDDFIALINHYVSIAEHKHLSSQQEKEIVPWFMLAAKIDPHNIQAYVVGGYWLGERLGRPDEALQFLEEGRMNNPDEWQIYEQFGDIYYRAKQDYLKAANYFKMCYRLMTGENSTVHDRKRILTFLAASYEKIEEYSLAIEYFKLLKQLESTAGDIDKRIKHLEELNRKLN
ncbi:MAG: hypothetical protein ABH952_06020 [Candidatus Omnitrophota bacterium]